MTVHHTTSDKAYAILRQKILTLELPPGSVINEANLVEELDFGRSPIREALRRLEQENLVVILPRQGTLVANISLADLQEVFELRMELEGLAAALAAKRAKRSHLLAFEQLLNDAGQSTQDNNDKLNIEIDYRFHQIIAEAAGNKYLQKSLHELFNHSVRLFNLSRTRSASVREEIPDYRAIYNCLRQKDPVGARSWMVEHIRASRERISNSFALSSLWE